MPTTEPLASLVIRPIAPGDSLAELTEFLHRAYAPLAAAGMRFFATFQTVDDTRKRVEAGHCFVAERDDGIVGTICIYPDDPASPCLHYRAPGMWHFGQFAVEPAIQRSGIGDRLLHHIERFAAAHGATHLGCDTAEGAAHLIAYYQRRGYEQIGSVTWDDVNYRSVVLGKRLDTP